MTTPNIEELRGLGEVAKHWRNVNVVKVTEDDGSASAVIGAELDGEFYPCVDVDCDQYYHESKPFADYLAAMNEHGLALLDLLQSQAERINALEREIERLTGSLRYEVDCVAAIGAERDDLRVQLDALQVDDELPPFEPYPEIPSPNKRGTWMGPMLNDCPPQVEPAPIGCDYCTSPLYAGTKCKSCGRVNEPAPSTAGERELEEAYGWLYDWTHSSATGRDDETFTSFTSDKDYALKHENVRAVYVDPKTTEPVGHLYRGTASHTKEKLVFETEKTKNLETRWWEYIGPVFLQSTAMPVGELTHLKGVDAGPLGEWVDLVTRGYVSKNELLIMEKDAVRVAAARSHPTTEESSVVAGAQPVQEPLKGDSNAVP